MLICPTTGMGPMLSDSSQTQKATYLLYASTSRKSTEQAKGCGQEPDECLPEDYGGAVGETAGGGSGE